MPFEEENDTNPLIEPSKPIALYYPLLEHNERMFMTKFGLHDGLPLLMIEVGVKTASALMINRALSSLTHYIKQISLARLKKQEQLVRGGGETKPTTIRQDEMATGIPHETIVRYIQNLSIAGWGIKESPRDLTWHLGYKGLLRVYDVYLNVTKMWAYFQVPILVDRVAPVLSAGNLEAQSLFLEYLLKLNATWFMAKIGISEADQVLLLVEVPVETLDFSLMQFLARTIGTYLDRYGQEIQIMALLHNDPRLSELLQAAAS